jgi:hypothetical protein
VASTQIRAIVQAVATILAGIPGVQRVTTYEPVAKRGETLSQAIGPSGDVHYWIVRQESTRTVRQVGYTVEYHHVVVLRGWIEVGDESASTPVVDALVEAVQQRFDLVFSIDDLAEMTGPLEVTWPVLYMLAETFLVYRIELRLPVQELVTVQ